MKKLLLILFIFISVICRSQDTAPTGVDFKSLPTYSFKYYAADSTIWMYKGTTYGWTKIPRDKNTYWYQITDIIGTDTTFVKVENKDTVNFFLYKLKSDSVTNPGYATNYKLTTYKEKSDSVTNPGYFTNYKGSLKEDKSNKVTSLSGSSTDTQYPSAKLTYDQLALKAPISDPTFITKITTPTLNITTGATLNYFWQCTNAATGAGQWTAVSATQYNMGGWDANTNTPTLANGTGTNGQYYTCTVAGTTNFGAGNITFETTDQVMYDGSIWFIIPSASTFNLTGPITSLGTATSIASQTGTGTTFAMSISPTFATQITTPLVYGSSSANGDVTIEGTSDATKTSSYVILQPTSGNVGINTNSPVTVLDIYSSTGTNAPRSTGTASLGSTSGGLFQGVTNLIPTAANQRLGGVIFGGVTTGTTYIYSSRMQGFSSEAWSSTTAGSYLNFYTTDNGTLTPDERMRIDQNGSIGIGTTTPLSKLSINGGIHVGGDSDVGDDNALIDGTLGVTGISTFTGLIKTVGGLHVGGTSDPGADNILADGTITTTSLVYANGGNSTEWNDAYDHALIAAGTGVHISDAERTAWNAKQAAITFGIANTNAVKIDMTGVADNDYAKFTATGLEGRSYSEVLSDIGAAATNQTFYIGTTSVAINRASAGLTLAGITLTSPVLGTPTSGTLTNCTQAHWDAAYNHSIIAGGTGVHISDAERTAWNAKQSATLSNGKILVGNASNVATAVTMTGDVTITNAGVSVIGAGKVTNTMVATAIDAVKLANGTVTNSELQYINSVTSDVQTQLNNKQPLHASLTSIAGLTEASGTLIYGTADNTYAILAAGTTSQILVGGGAAAPVWTTATGTGAPVRSTSPTLVTPVLGTPASGTLTNCTQSHWDAAYTHSQIAGGNSVHVSTTENTQWDAAYTHSVDNTQAHSDYLLNNTNDITSGTLTAVNFILSSDRRLKENISYIKNLHKFDVDFVQFNLKSDPRTLRFGVIAQDLEKVAPELVRTDSEGMKSVAYIDLLCIKIAQLEQRVKELEKAEQKHIKRDWWFYKKIKNEK